VETVSVAQITHRDAIAEALRAEMTRDPGVIVVSDDSPGSPVCDGLVQFFGAERVLDFDRARQTAVGIASGMALEGRRVVCEVSAADLPSHGLEHLDEAARLHEQEGVPVPIVARVLCGPTSEGWPVDRDGPERWLLPIRGLRVVSPASAADAKGLMVGAIRDPGPVCVLEHTQLYGDVGAVPEGDYTLPIGEAGIVHDGERMTVIAHGAAVAAAVDAATDLDAGVEVVDLRTLAPLDSEAIVASIARTGKALLVEETAATSAVARAVMAAIWEGAFEHLDAPLRRVGLAAAAVESGGLAKARVNAVKEGCDELLSY